MAEPNAAARRLSDDKLAIRELLELYADAVIRNDADTWRSTWSDVSAEWHIGGAVIEDADAIVAHWTSRMAEFERVLFRVSVGPIDVGGDVATARSYTAELFKQSALPDREVFGRYDDLLRRETGGWRFVRRIFSRLN